MQNLKINTYTILIIGALPDAVWYLAGSLDCDFDTAYDQYATTDSGTWCDRGLQVVDAKQGLWQNEYNFATINVIPFCLKYTKAQISTPIKFKYVK